MLAFIRANYKNGDTILINCTVGAIEGKIAFVSQDSIVLRLPNDKIYGIAASDIRSFTAATPHPLVTDDLTNKEDTVQPEATATDNENLMDYANEALQAEGDNEKESTEKPTSIADVLGTKEKGHDEVLDSLGKEEPQVKVVGKISLEQLNRIDPKGAARRTSYQKGYASSTENNDSEENGTESAHHQSAPYVPAMGRITYYNRDKRYGFIHDYKQDVDLYFHVHQVADTNLYERINRGLKVVYTATEKATGHVAVCVHFPNTVENLLDKADEYIEKGYYDFANGIINHVLAVYPDNADALEMAQEVKDLVPVDRKENAAPRISEKKYTAADDSTLYKPDALYTTAKRASIMHDYDKAEEYYIKAIEADERTVSSVKDLLQVFVMRFKNVDTDAEREMWHDEATKAYEKYKNLLPDDISTLQFLAGNFYLPLLDYKKYLELTEQLLEKPELADDKTKRAFYLWQRALALHKDGRDSEALTECNRALEVVPYHSQSKSLKRVLLQALETSAEESTDQQTSSEAQPASEASEEELQAEASSTASEAAASEDSASEAAHAEAADEATAEDSASDSTADDTEEEAASEDATTEASTEAASTDENEGIKKPDSWWDELSGTKEY